MAKVLIGNFKGPQGGQGIPGPQGEQGDQGIRGSRSTEGTAITGTSTTPTVFSGTGISDALAEDMYLNTDTGNAYRCTTGGVATVAKWVYACNLKGIKGDTGAKGDPGTAGPKGEKGDTGEQGPKGDTPTVADNMTVAFTQASSRSNIATGEKLSVIMGKIKKFFADLTAPAFAQMITTKEDLLATKVTGYVPDAKAVADTYTELNGKLGNYGNDIIMGKLLSVNDNHILDLFKNAPANYSPTFGQLNIGGPIVAYIMQKHSDYYGGAVIVFGYNNFRPIYYHIVNGTINAEYYL
ncbi:collagen-like protein [Waltera sp.]|uniref:collagen-like triple helix repeat-containing protein n=1 Tax=Waltera sp. TaxID=2815806 RepID=UPI0039A0365E